MIYIRKFTTETILVKIPYQEISGTSKFSIKFWINHYFYWYIK